MFENLKGALLLLAVKVLGFDKQQDKDNVDINEEESEKDIWSLLNVETPAFLNNITKQKHRPCNSHNAD